MVKSAKDKRFEELAKSCDEMRVCHNVLYNRLSTVISLPLGLHPAVGPQMLPAAAPVTLHSEPQAFLGTSA